MRRPGITLVRKLPTFAERIRRLRMDLGLSQQAIAEAIGVSQSTVASWEVGRCYPEVMRLLMLASLYEVEPGVLLDGLDVPDATDTSGEPELTTA